MTPLHTHPTLRELITGLTCLRFRLESLFCPETAAPGTPEGGAPSAGHCAVVALVVRAWFGGQLVGARVFDQPHWFNRIPLAGGYEVDVDLTGDQFTGAGGPFPPLQLTRSGRLYDGTKVLDAHEVLPEICRRARKLQQLDAGMMLRGLELPVSF